MKSDQLPTRLLVVRHGQSETNVSRRLSSKLPGPPLTATGRTQAQEVGRVLADRPVTAIYASAAIRAQQTAAEIADELTRARKGVSVQTLLGVHEFDLGECEGSDRDHDWALVDAAFDRWLDDDLAHGLPGAESGKDVVARMTAALAGVVGRHPGQTVVVVSHGGAMALTLPRLASNVPNDRSRGAGIGNCGLVELIFDPAAGQWQLVSWPSRAPGLGSAAYPGDLGEILGRASAALNLPGDLDRPSRPPITGLPSGHTRHASIGGVPCIHQVGVPSSALATLTALPYPPRPALMDAVIGWLVAQAGQDWRIRVEAHWADLLAARHALHPISQRGVWLCEQVEAPPGLDPSVVLEPGDPAQALALLGPEQTALWGQTLADREFLVLRREGHVIGGVVLRDVAGTSYVGQITVVPQWRRQGWGRLIGFLATQRALQRSALAWLYCQDELGEFYRRLGYDRVTTHVHLGPRPTG